MLRGSFESGAVHKLPGELERCSLRQPQERRHGPVCAPNGFCHAMRNGRNLRQRQRPEPYDPWRPQCQGVEVASSGTSHLRAASAS